MMLRVLFTAVLLFTKVNTESSEDMYMPSNVNFNEIFTNSLSMLNDDSITTVTKDDYFHLNNLPNQFVEFHQQPQTQTSTEPITTPKPRFLTASYLKKETHSSSTTTESTTSTSTTTTTTAKAEDSSVNVLPIKNYERGVLDLLFPAARVKSFKNVFNTVRRMLSYTFRK